MMADESFICLFMFSDNLLSFKLMNGSVVLDILLLAHDRKCQDKKQWSYNF